MSGRGRHVLVFFLLLLLAAMPCLLFTPPVAAMELVKLSGTGRVLKVYTAREIPDYLRTSSTCRNYAYAQKFGNVVVRRNGRIDDVSPAAGDLPDDIRVMKRHDICLLRLQHTGMIKGTRRPVNIYAIDALDGQPPEIRAGENHREMDNGSYELDNGLRFSVLRGAVTITGPGAGSSP